MFYSHEVLTSRKYGVATVWLVATLGSKSSSKRITRKAIQDVDVPKACETIIDPAAPMALRLQGNLLYGVSRVYLQQCGYVLSDAQNVYNSMHLMLRALEDAALDPQAGKSRPDQLVLPDDPSFLPEFAMPAPELLAELDLGPAPPALRDTGDSQSLAPLESQEQNPSTPAPLGGIVLPTSSSVGPGGFVIQGNGPSSIGGAVIGDEDIIDAPDFTFNENGEFVDLTEINAGYGAPAAFGDFVHNDREASAGVRLDRETGLNLENDLPGNEMNPDPAVLNDGLLENGDFPLGDISPQIQHSEVVESSDIVVAPVRRKKRTARVLHPDTTMELRNKDLANWNANYLANMKEASKQKNQHRVAQLAKKNAEYWMWGSGIGGIAARAQGVTGRTPFDRFVGDNLFQFFTGVNRQDAARSKRDRDSGIDEATQEESRRVRQRTEEAGQEVGRGQEDEDFFVADDDVELPREEQLALDHQQRLSEMPWNITASIRGSSAIPRSGRVGLGGSAPPSSQTGRGARLVSESPLHRRSQLGGLDPLQFLEDDEGNLENLGRDDYFGFAGPVPSSDMPEAMLIEPNASVREALTTEGENFLVFVADAIDGKRNQIEEGLDSRGDVPQDEAAAVASEVSFEEIFPSNTNDKVIASQALMMTLTLGTKGLLNVHQEDHFADITLSLTEKGIATQFEVTIQEEDEADVGQEEHSQDEAGHFDEQFAAGYEDSGDEADEDEGSVFGF